jgi:hypothetical protein
MQAGDEILSDCLIPVVETLLRITTSPKGIPNADVRVESDMLTDSVCYKSVCARVVA